MVQVDGVRQIARARQGDHFGSLVDFVGYRFFPEHGNIGSEQLHRRFVMVAAVFLAGGGDADHAIAVNQRRQLVPKVQIWARSEQHWLAGLDGVPKIATQPV